MPRETLVLQTCSDKEYVIVIEVYDRAADGDVSRARDVFCAPLLLDDLPQRVPFLPVPRCVRFQNHSDARISPQDYSCERVEFVRLERLSPLFLVLNDLRMIAIAGSSLVMTTSAIWIA